MDIVYLIGNGFDIKLGLKTRYAEFYKWYMTREPSEYAAVNEFRSAIDPNHELWADMEWAMCQYLKEVKREETKRQGMVAQAVRDRRRDCGEQDLHHLR